MLKPTYLLLLPALLLATVARGQPPYPGTALPRNYQPPGRDTLTILSWNVEHFVDPHDDPYVRSRREDAPTVPVRDKERLLARALVRANADVVVLQEFESDSYAQALADSLFPELGYRFFAAARSPNWYMNVVVLSRLPLGTIYSYKAVTTPVLNGDSSDTQHYINTRMMAVDVLANEDYTFTITGLHLKAGRKSRDVGTRLGQIAFLRGQWARFLRENPAANLLVAGDLNATPDSREVQALLGAGTEVVFVDPLAGQAVYSHPSEGPSWRIDHLLPNANMAAELVAGSVGPVRLLSAREMMKVSDHLPMRARFVAHDVPPARP